MGHAAAQRHGALRGAGEPARSDEDEGHDEHHHGRAHGAGEEPVVDRERRGGGEVRLRRGGRHPRAADPRGDQQDRRPDPRGDARPGESGGAASREHDPADEQHGRDHRHPPAESDADGVARPDRRKGVTRTDDHDVVDFGDERSQRSALRDEALFDGRDDRADLDAEAVGRLHDDAAAVGGRRDGQRPMGAADDLLPDGAERVRAHGVGHVGVHGVLHVVAAGLPRAAAPSQRGRPCRGRSGRR
ncbi:hypothetical protein MhomT_07050 [Microbacterium hominis]|nr:hypothetical protein MhomT_07050 [Microbacterium hominis]